MATPLIYDWKQLKLFNTLSISGVNTGMPENSNQNYETFINDGPYCSHLWSKIGLLKKIHYQRFIWKNLPDGIEAEDIEEQLFLWGKTCIFKLGDEYKTANFTIIYNDFYMKPRTIKPIPKNSDTKIRNLKVGKFTEAIYNDDSFLWGKTFYGILWQFWNRLLHLDNIFTCIQNNLPMICNFLATDPDSSDEEIAKMEQEIKNTKTVKKIDTNAMLNNLKSGAGDNLFSFNEKTTELLQNYYFMWEQIKSEFGVSSVAAPDKKERMITDEVKINNSISDAVIENQLQNRKNAIIKINKTFGLNISVEINQDEKILLKDGEETNDGNENSNISKK